MIWATRQHYSTKLQCPISSPLTSWQCIRATELQELRLAARRYRFAPAMCLSNGCECQDKNSYSYIKILIHSHYCPQRTLLQYNHTTAVNLFICRELRFLRDCRKNYGTIVQGPAIFPTLPSSQPFNNYQSQNSQLSQSILELSFFRMALESHSIIELSA